MSLGIPLPLDDVVIEWVVNGLGTFNGLLLVGGRIGIGEFCYWRYRLVSAGGMAQDDGLGDVTWSEYINGASSAVVCMVRGDLLSGPV